jgi:hypothetical protein
MPALAPVLKPVSASTTAIPFPVGATVTSAQWALSSMSVQLCVTAQHPPPRLVAQESWPVVQPGGTKVTTAELVGARVEMHLLLAPHVDP